MSSFLWGQDFLAECDDQIKETNTQMHQLNDAYRHDKKEIDQGLICSECKRTKRQIQEQENEEFQKHLKRVDGIAVTPSYDDLREAREKLREKYERDWNRLQEQKTRVEVQCQKKLLAYNENQVQNRLEEEQEAARLRDAQLAQMAVQKQEIEQNLYNTTNEINSAIRTGIIIGSQNRMSSIEKQSSAIRNIEIKLGHSESEMNNSFDNGTLNDVLSDFTLEEDFEPEYQAEKGINIPQIEMKVWDSDMISEGEIYLETSEISEGNGSYFDDFYNSLEDKIFNKYNKAKSFVFESWENLRSYSLNALGYAIDDKMEYLHYPVGTTYGQYLEYRGYYDNTLKFGQKLENRWNRYEDNFFNRDPLYDIDQELNSFERETKVYLLDLMSIRIGIIDFRKMTGFFEN